MASAASLIKQIDKEVFKFINRNTPGPLTFVLEAGKEVPHHFRNKRKTIGIRIPNHYFLRQLLEEFGRPILTTSLPLDEAQELMYPEDLVLLHQADLAVWIDDERNQNNPSTIIDCTTWPFEILRDGGQEIIF